jgi:hypothetical protein
MRLGLDEAVQPLIRQLMWPFDVNGFDYHVSGLEVCTVALNLRISSILVVRVVCV